MTFNTATCPVDKIAQIMAPHGDEAGDGGTSDVGGDDTVPYQSQLIANGYDCQHRMMYVREEDLHFMTSVHQRTLIANVKSVPVERLDASNK